MRRRPAVLEDLYLSQVDPTYAQRFALDGDEVPSWYEDPKPKKRDTSPEGLEAERRAGEIFTLDEVATYKVEIMFRERSAEYAVCRVDAWVHGRQEAGGNDDHMFFCGYPECGKPIFSVEVGQLLDPDFLRIMPKNTQISQWAVCRACAKAGREHGGKQTCAVEASRMVFDAATDRFIESGSRMRVKDNEGREYPCMRDGFFLAGPMSRIAERVARLVEDLQCDTDLYLKHFERVPVPPDVRRRLRRDQLADLENHYKDAAMYHRAALQQDLASGSSLALRLRTFFLA